jgi:hypothetical protein
MKKIIIGTVFIIVVLISALNSYYAWGFFPGRDESSFEKHYVRLQKQYEKAVNFAEKNIIKEKNYFLMSKWERWFARWNDELMNIKEDLREQSDEHPLVFDYFAIVLRDLNLLYLEYDGIFKGERSTGLALVNERKKSYEQDMANLERELEFVRKKDTYLAEEYFYQRQ